MWDGNGIIGSFRKGLEELDDILRGIELVVAGDDGPLGEPMSTITVEMVLEANEKCLALQDLIGHRGTVDLKIRPLTLTGQIDIAIVMCTLADIAFDEQTRDDAIAQIEWLTRRTFALPSRMLRKVRTGDLL